MNDFDNTLKTLPLAQAAADARAMRETVEELCARTVEYVKRKVADSQRWPAPPAGLRRQA